MKGIILAGGRGTRLRPLTLITCKQLLPVYDKPMIYYPIQTLVSSGITDILIIIAPDYSGQFLNLLGSGKQFGAKFSYAIQDEPRGLADAYRVAADFIGHDSVTMILGDNIFDQDFSSQIRNFSGGGLVFATPVDDPSRFGVVEFSPDGHVISIEEKPQQPKSHHALVGLYVFDSRVVDIAQSVQPSARGELEITDIMNDYLHRGELKVETVSGLWEDAGTFESLLKVGNYMAQKTQSQS